MKDREPSNQRCLFINPKRWKRWSRESRLPLHSRLATPMRLRAGELVEPSTPLWYMLIAITPRVRYRAGARCSAWRATELRQLCANLLNSNLTGSHLPPLVRAATAVPSQAGSSTWNWIIPPFRDSSRGCTFACARARARIRVPRACMRGADCISSRARPREIGESVCWKKQITGASSKMIFYQGGERDRILRAAVCAYGGVREDY